MTFEELKKNIEKYSSNADIGLVEKAYQFALEKHRNSKRLSGDSYITHPLAVAGILVELQQDIPTICAAFLHDTVEDSDATIDDIANLFSPDIAKLVKGVTKLGQLVYDSKEERQAENFRKMFISMGEDLRVIIIKLADRLHNMQTLKWLPKDKIYEISLETKDIFAPLAHRLGMWRLKWELEDLSFKYLEPEKYDYVQAKVAESRQAREAYIEKFIAKLKESFKSMNITGEVKGRPKHLYSIYRKMASQNLEFEQIYDLTAVRVILDSLKDCYAVLGLVHAQWKPIPGRFRDYIAVPKSNGYQSLHTTVIGDEGKPVEVQIRTVTMHRTSEYGIAAHWVYKESGTDKNFDKKMSWFRQMLETQTELKDAKDFMDSLKINLFIDEIFVFTPRGKVIQLPIDATPVDFAYHVHTEVGHRCTGAKVNGRIVALDCKLKSGDIVEIITGKVDAPSRGWINFVKTSGARAKIKSWLKKFKQEDNLIAEEVKTAKKEKTEIRLPVKRPRKRKIVHGVKVSGLSGIMIKIARCCKPLPGDEIIGFVTQGKGVAIHRKDCSSLLRNKPDIAKLVNVEWDMAADIYYPMEIEIEAFDRVGVLKDILTQIAETKTNVSSASTKTKRGNIAFLRLMVDVKNVDQLQKVINAVRSVSDVYEVR
ncbi:hypothetical protein A2246_00755 [candidate division WOR-1 bacterium RIFOXYA2_FULL_37_7]|uniref:(P)ppGpp synthetase n=1 Tax=candidate division WOR-1 bacterium RIFOXYB2_FULL_37_13 TaxID=1802579 RepID=A0A1F4SXB3_UNCSA|nr:MAG: hypothetical protein A2246_00755 [candidate division WOR-1 bacterium RIFOXYA2_FULL_37_7]OGC25057.1 MAG: hypothetical protein A2310_00105 [candidate division WOR-1 bacterium RIFOXYB2_FULL_37_13]